MPALLITDSFEAFKDRINEAFNDFQVLEVSEDPSKYYEQAHQVRIALSYNPIFIFILNPTLAVLSYAHVIDYLLYKQSMTKKIFVVEWTDRRFRFLKVP